MASRLTYYRWYIDEVETMRELFSPAQMGELFFAVMDYVRDGTVREVSAETRYAYIDCMKKVDRSRTAYEKKVANLSANGAKGGRARAENARRDQEEKQTAPSSGAGAFVPPTRRRFHQTARRLAGEEGAEAMDGEAVDALYDRLEGEGWTIDGEPLRGDGDWKGALRVGLSPYRDNPLLGPLFRYLFRGWRGLRDETGESRAEAAAADLLDRLQEDGTWSVRGETFDRDSWREAARAYIEGVRRDEA